MTAIPTEAATVIILRPCPEKAVEDIEVLMVQRNQKSSFVPGYYVFPGGVIDKEDYESGVERFIPEIAGGKAAAMFADMSHPKKAVGAFVAGIRETFEEVGILFGRKKDGSPFAIQTEDDRRRFVKYRNLLVKGTLKFFRILEREDILLPGDCLHYFAHWITPEALPQRYDVRFFAAEAPMNQLATVDGVELTGYKWFRPQTALADYKAKKVDLVLPQIMTLVELLHFRTVAEVIASAEQKKITARLTKIKHIDGNYVEVMPDGTVFEGRPPVY